ncbi:MAG: T9SS type A sorting domain-containing protein [Crocinitomicaceae bacterium]|nr:T9SS type A sorting domain-containing protein [Crocinitomicaceae bacterium]MDG1775937.1 T9SS type A sorting domain-containing protein [Crocinitomicaceae bacterium]
MKLIQTILLALSLITLDTASASASWIQRADFGSIGRHRGMGISIGNKGYIGLGHYNGTGVNYVLADWWQYDPSTNSWTQKADYIGNNGNGNYGVLSFGMEQYGFVGGGQLASNRNFYRYDPITNTWTQVENTPTFVDNTAGFSIGTKGYYIDGNDVYEYDSQTDSWLEKNSAPFYISIWPSTFTIDGKGYVKTNSGFWEYKPTLDLWTSRASFPGFTTAGAVGFHQNNKGYIIGGYGGNLGNVNSETWEFNPATNTWTARTEFYGTSRRFSSGFTIGNRAYIGTGTNGTNFNDFWEFDALLGLEEMFDQNKFKCYPNPAVEYISFKSENLNEFDIVVYNTDGKVIKRESTSTNEVRIHRGRLIAGVYYYAVISKGQVVYKNKFIFQ